LIPGLEVKNEDVIKELNLTLDLIMEAAGRKYINFACFFKTKFFFLSDFINELIYRLFLFIGKILLILKITNLL
jgi:hypothetical protein